MFFWTCHEFNHPMFVHRNWDVLCSIRAPGLQRAQVGGRLHQHTIARVDEDFSQQIQGLLRPGSHQDIVGGDVDSEARGMAGDHLPQREIPFRGAVLQG